MLVVLLLGEPLPPPVVQGLSDIIDGGSCDKQANNQETRSSIRPCQSFSIALCVLPLETRRTA